MQNEDIHYKIKMVKEILRSITISHPSQLDFLFVAIENTDKENLEFMFNVESEKSLKGFNLINEMSAQNYMTQQRYKYEAETQRSNIVYCISSEFVGLDSDIIPMISGRLYKVIEMRKVGEEMFYDLEFILNKKGFVGYNSRNFLRIASSNAVN